MLGEPWNPLAVVHAVGSLGVEVHAVAAPWGSHLRVASREGVVVVNAKEKWVRSWKGTGAEALNRQDGTLEVRHGDRGTHR